MIEVSDVSRCIGCEYSRNIIYDGEYKQIKDTLLACSGHYELCGNMELIGDYIDGKIY